MQTATTKPEPEYIPVDNNSPEWERIEKKLQKSLPGAKLKRLDRVQNQYTWRRFYRHVVSHHEADGAGHIDFTRPDSMVQELWHASGAIDAICKGKLGCACAYALVCLHACLPRSFSLFFGKTYYGFYLVVCQIDCKFVCSSF